VRQLGVEGWDRVAGSEAGRVAATQHDLTGELQMDHSHQLREQDRQILPASLDAGDWFADQVVERETLGCFDQLRQRQFVAGHDATDELFRDPAADSLDLWQFWHWFPVPLGLRYTRSRLDRWRAWAPCIAYLISWVGSP